MSRGPPLRPPRRLSGSGIVRREVRGGGGGGGSSREITHTNEEGNHYIHDSLRKWEGTIISMIHEATSNENLTFMVY